EAVGERRLANAARPAEQPRVMHATAAIGIEESPLRLQIAEPVAPLLREWPARDLVETEIVLPSGRGFPRPLHAAASPRSRSATERQIDSATRSSVCVPSITTQRDGSFAAIAR